MGATSVEVHAAQVETEHAMQRVRGSMDVGQRMASTESAQLGHSRPGQGLGAWEPASGYQDGYRASSMPQMAARLRFWPGASAGLDTLLARCGPACMGVVL